MPIIFSSSTTTQTMADGDEGYLLPDRFIATTTGDAINVATDANFVALFIDGAVTALAGTGIRLGQDSNGIGGNTVVIGTTGIVRGQSSWSLLSQGNGDYLENHGQMFGRQSLTMSGDFSELRNFGSISGEITGMSFSGANSTMENHGSITGAFGVSLSGDDSRLFNSGTISGGTLGPAIGVSGLGARIENDGTIFNLATTDRTAIFALENIHVEIINRGLISGVLGAIELQGASSNDTLINSGEIVGDVLLGGGNDVYDGRNGTVQGRIAGGIGSDTYYVDDTDIDLTEFAGQGNDTVFSSVGFRLAMNFENLNLLGDGDIDGYGNTQSNSIFGNLGNNLLQGGNGGDTLDGAEGNDILRGNRGNDTFLFSEGNDDITGGKGIDTLDYATAGDNATIDLTAGTASIDGKTDQLHGIENADGSAEADSILGSGQNNVLKGLGGGDTIEGRNGNDTVRGGNGDDDLNGGNGNDIVDGGPGVDILRGGTGDDLFDFNNAGDSGVGGGNRDQIVDFNRVDDLMDLAGIDADTGTGGNQAFSFIGTNAFTGTAGELRFVNQGTQTRVLGDVDGDGAADFEVLLVQGMNLAAGDFIL